MKRQIIAIGGGGFGRNPGEGIIENYILNQSNAKNPNICFIPTATGDNEAYKNNYYATFTKLNCNPVHLDFFKRTSIVTCNSQNLKKIGKDAIVLANQEGLQAHALSIECRIKN